MIYYNNTERIDNTVFDIQKKTLDRDYPVHWHNYFELEYVIKGSGIYTIDGVSYNLEPGMLFFLTPLNFHSLVDSDVELYNISFIGSVCDEKYLSLITNIPSITCKASGHDRIFFDAIFEELLLNNKKSDIYPLYLNCIIAKLSQLVTYSSNTTPEFYQKAILYILANFRSDITLNDIATHTGFTPTYFSKLFKEQIGSTFKNYLLTTRLEYAKKLILFSNMTIQQVCNESGFDDYANFIKQFKKHFEHSPTHYKSIYAQNPARVVEK